MMSAPRMTFRPGRPRFAGASPLPRPLWRACLGLALAAPLGALAAAPQPAACPAEVPADARCYTGQDSAGAFYSIAIPANWNKVLVMHAHGGPDLGASKPSRSQQDLTRWAVTVKAGYAWAGSAYRRGGYGVTMAAEDTERLRQLFVSHFGAPRRTLLHGQSYGGGVAAKAAELYGPAPGRAGVYDGVLLTNGVLGGGDVAYDARLDLRVVYQYVCRNHPRPDEPAYPLWMGLPADATLTRADLAARVRECTGLGMPAAERSAEQRDRLAAILAVVKVPERTMLAHLNWATWHFQDIVHKRLDGRNPFRNTGVVYRGTADDAALNARVARYEADPAALAQLRTDSTPSGRIGLPVLTLHAIHDPTAFVELESRYREIVEQAGASQWLVQTFSDENQHSYLSEPQYPALFAALLDWVERGDKPTPHGIAQRCAGFEAAYGNGGKERCRFVPDYRSPPLDERVPAR